MRNCAVTVRSRHIDAGYRRHIDADINEIVMANSLLLAGFLGLKSADVGPKSVDTSSIVHSVEADTDRQSPNLK